MNRDADLINKLKEFFEENYTAQILSSDNSNKGYLEVSFKKLAKEDPELAEFALDNPKSFLTMCRLAIESKNTFQIRMVQLSDDHLIGINKLTKRNLGKLVKIKGMVVSRSSVYMSSSMVKFECPSCGREINVPQLDDLYREPTKCSCGRKGKFAEISKDYTDMLDIQIEEVQDNLKQTETAANIKAMFVDSLVKENHKVYPGGNIELTGYLVANQSYVNRRKGNLFQFIFEVCSYRNLDGLDFDMKYSKEELEKFEEIRTARDPVKMISEMIFPDIHGHDDAKEMSIMQQFCGTLTETGKRDFIHILFIGHPGTAKTDICKRSIALNSRSRFSTAKTSTDVGLTATVQKDDKSERWVAKAGLLPICSGAVVGLDEINNMSPERLDVLRTPMETGILPINKAGISLQMWSNTCISGTCNPKSGIDFDESVRISAKVVDIHDALIDRFDLIYKFFDNIDATFDYKIAKKMDSRDTFVDTDTTFVKNNTTFVKSTTTNNILSNLKLIKKYIFYCKTKNVQYIKFSRRLCTYMSEWYVEVRQRSQGISFEGKKPTPRIYEGVKRLARCFARIRQKENVTIKEFNIAKNYYERMLGIPESKIKDGEDV